MPKPTLQVEVTLVANYAQNATQEAIRSHVVNWVNENYSAVKIGDGLEMDEDIKLATVVECVEVTDFTGPPSNGVYDISKVNLNVHLFVLKEVNDTNSRRTVFDPVTDASFRRVLALPNKALKHDWATLVFDDHLHVSLLRYLARMVKLTKKSGMNVDIFNWNGLFLLHGPPGSGKSTLCRGLAQKLSIRLNDIFPTATMVEVNANDLLSKFFGESGKRISAAFEQIHVMAMDNSVLVCVIIDEIETIAGTRDFAVTGGECRDGLRATNQLLTALDKLRYLPNVVILCTSNLMSAIDLAFLDRVDIKQLIPSPSQAAIYNIFRSCLNEMIRAQIIDVETHKKHYIEPEDGCVAATQPFIMGQLRRVGHIVFGDPKNHIPKEEWNVISSTEIPSLAVTRVRFANLPLAPGPRVYRLAGMCYGMSGRTLRRLPLAGVGQYTWSEPMSLEDGVKALEIAIETELAGDGGIAQDVLATFQRSAYDYEMQSSDSQTMDEGDDGAESEPESDPEGDIDEHMYQGQIIMRSGLSSRNPSRTTANTV